jgi:tetratricopeptide (TPR) repeat protein
VAWRADLANTINKLGMNLQKTGDLTGARAQFEAQKRTCEQLVAADPDSAEWKFRLAFAQGHLATALVSLGETGAAERELESTLAIEQTLSAKDPENAERQRNLAMTMARLAALRRLRGRTAEADAGFRSALAMLEEVVRRDPDRVSFRGDLLVVRARSAMGSLQRRDLPAARQAWERIRGGLDGGSGADTPARQLEVLLAGVAVARATGEAEELATLRERAENLLATPPLRASSEPDVVALRARLLVESGHRNAALPLIQRLDAIGYHHPDYEWTMRGQ